MRPREPIPDPSAALLGYLDVAQQVVGDDFLPRSYRDILAGLTTTEHLMKVERDESHPLWWFLPPILYDIFDEKLEFEWFKQSDTSKRSIVVIPPPFVAITEQLQHELTAVGLNSSQSTREFSRRFVGLLYGGYPWFESYIRICDAHELSTRQCALLLVESETCDVPRTLEVFKKRRRDSFGQSLQMAFTDLPHPGLIRPFHSPARIEVQRHMRAAQLD